jgi:hypothetical protein
VKVTLRNIRSTTRPNQVGIIKDFVSFLQDNSPSKDDVLIVFQSNRGDQITTGKQWNSSIFVFSKDRLLIDILRTIAHEWAHVIQVQDGKHKEKNERELEDLANSLAGFLVRKFVKENPEHETEVYKD